MTEDNKKIITVSFVATSMLTAFVLHLILTMLSAHISIIARLQSQEIFANGFPVVVGIVLFAVLQFNRKSVDFADAVVSELKKVVWPSRKDTGLMTVMVVIMLIISGIVVGVFDATWAFVINYFIQ